MSHTHNSVQSIEAVTQDTSCMVTLTIDPGNIPSFLAEACEHAQRGDHDAARQLLTKERLSEISTLTPGSARFVDAHSILGQTWKCLGCPNEAVESFEHVRTYRPDSILLIGLADTYKYGGRFSQARDCYRDLLEHLGDRPDISSSYAICLMATGGYQEGRAIFERLLNSGQITPEAHLSYLFSQYYCPGMDRGAFLAGYRAWAERHLSAITTTRVYGNSPDPNRCLRIGYLSGDFRKHSVAFSFEPLLDGHNREQFKCFGYGHSEHQDDTTVRLIAKFDQYRDVTGHSPSAIADSILHDRIDLLISLASHCHVRSMKTLALRPAPIQIDIGSASSTGLSNVDYRITDALLDPPESQPFYTETLIHIPNGYQPYRPPQNSPPV
ncbi:hypothetical protein ACFL3F_05770, partial [Planctomycetota bacterium]